MKRFKRITKTLGWSLKIFFRNWAILMIAAHFTGCASSHSKNNQVQQSLKTVGSAFVRSRLEVKTAIKQESMEGFKKEVQLKNRTQSATRITTPPDFFLLPEVTVDNIYTPKILGLGAGVKFTF